MLNTNLPLMKRNIYHPAIGCSCGLHTWPTLLQSVCKVSLHSFNLLTTSYVMRKKLLKFYNKIKVVLTFCYKRY